MLISYPVVPFTPCHVLLGVVYSHCPGSINKEMPMLSFIHRHDNTPSSCALMCYASRRIYNVQAAAAAAGNLNMSTHNSTGCSTARAVSYPAVGRADLRGWTVKPLRRVCLWDTGKRWPDSWDLFSQTQCFFSLGNFIIACLDPPRRRHDDHHSLKCCAQASLQNEKILQV